MGNSGIQNWFSIVRSEGWYLASMASSGCVRAGVAGMVELVLCDVFEVVDLWLLLLLLLRCFNFFLMQEFQKFLISLSVRPGKRAAI